ncbi:antitermination regulator [Streptomyces sp. WAC 05379]|uniref:ANTAR domain-containing protein n=1 Tax=Streptomyces sp. WAC 05379 TaxID=2203207 RepID=UPI000F73DF18|nr:ANTAR domain-containing protein [Streptomyces sp. WAC 05379]RSN94626.1 antitermination regulator [Streptomyces sp. WAC 05379]
MSELTSSVPGPDGDRVSVEVRGELDLDTSERLRGALREALRRSVRGVDLDLKGVTFCDCAALNILLALRLRALRQGKTVVISASGAVVDRLLDLTRTRELFAGPGADGEGASAAGSREVAEVSEDFVEDLRIEVAQLRRAMQTRPTIDLARGILMASFGLSSEDAWTVLVEASQNTNTKLHALAGDLVTAVKGEPLPEAVREQLSSAVAKVGSARPVAGASRLR